MNLIDLIKTMPGYVDATDPTDAAVLTWLNQTVTVWIDVPWLEYAIWLDSVDGYALLEDAKAGILPADIPPAATATKSQRAAAGLALAIVNAGQDLAASRTEVRASMGKLIPDVFSTTARDALLAMAQKGVTRLEANDVSWLGAVLIEDIAEVRK